MEAPRKRHEAPKEAVETSESGAHSLALQYKGEVFVGSTIEEAEDALASKYPDFGSGDEPVLNGFATEAGKFLSRKEAFDHLVREGAANRNSSTE